jgi:WD40 repeat protein
MGVVYEARHRSLHRLVALKMVLAGEFASSTQELRFRLEAELAARMQHPNIVQLYEIGVHEGRPFLAMEWVDGGSLADRLDGNPWPPAEAAQLIETLARAIHAAHSEGVVHRDLKPANILLSVGQAFQPDGSDVAPVRLESLTYKIADFGLARPVRGDEGLTKSGLLVGTPGYMAPEQAGGNSALVGPATDTYALGVVLYELLTGQLPFQGDSALAVLRAVTSDEPARPRRLRRRIPRDLEAITLHCLEKEPRRRYPSALALAEDLQRFREGKQVVARPVGAVARLARWCRRKPLVALVLALLAVSVCGGLGGVTWKWLEANEQRDLADAGARQAGAEKQAALRQAYRARIAAATAALQVHDVVEAGRQLADAPEALRDWEWRHLHSRLDESSAVFPKADGTFGFPLFCPEGLRLASNTNTGVRLTDEYGHETLALNLRPFRSIWHMGETRRGMWLLVEGLDDKLRLLDGAGQARLSLPRPQISQPRMAVSPDHARLAIWSGWSGDSEAFGFAVYEAAPGRQPTTFSKYKEPLLALAFSPDGTRIVTSYEDGTVRLWDAATGRVKAELRKHTVKVGSVAFRPDGARFLTAAADGTVGQWASATGEEVEPPYEPHTGEVSAAIYSPDGEWIASTGTDRTVRLWRASGRKKMTVLHGHTGAVSYLAYSRDGRRLASVSSDGTVRTWEADPQVSLPVLRGHTSYVYPVAYSPDGRWIASGSWDHTVLLWDSLTGEGCAKLRLTDRVRALAFSPGGSWLVSGCDGEDRLQIWDVATGRRRKEIRGPGKALQAVTVSPDGTRIAAADRGGRVSVMEVATGREVASFPMGGGFEKKGLAYSPDGRRLAGTGEGNHIYIWDTQANCLSARWAGHAGDVYSVAFSGDGRRLVSAGSDRTVRVWDAGTGECLAALNGHTDEVLAAVFHPDGTRVASAGRDQAIWLWDMTAAEEEKVVARLQGHTDYVFSLTFGPDGKTLVSGSGDTTVRLWDTEPLAKRYQARREAEGPRPEAERPVARLFAELREPAPVVARLRADSALGDPLRRAALRAVMRRGGATGPDLGPR